MATWMKAIRRDGVKAAVGGEPGAWLARVAASDGMSAACSQAEVDEAVKDGAAKKIVRVLRGYPDSCIRGDGRPSDVFIKDARWRDRNAALAWSAARHVIISAAVADPAAAAAILPETSSDSDRPLMTVIVPLDDTMKGLPPRNRMSVMMAPCEVYYTFAMYADDPVGTLKSLGFKAAAQITRYARGMGNKRRYSLTEPGIISMGEQCGREGPEAVASFLDILARAHAGSWDDVVPVTMGTVRDHVNLPDTFIREASLAESGGMEDGEYWDECKRIALDMDMAFVSAPRNRVRDAFPGYMHRFVKKTLRDLRPKDRKEGLEALRLVARFQMTLTGPLFSDPAQLKMFWSCEYETPIHAVRRIIRILSNGEDGILRWAVFTSAVQIMTSHLTGRGVPIPSPCPEGYGSYVDDGKIPDAVTVKIGGRNGRARMLPVGPDFRKALETMPDTMDRFLKTTGPRGKYKGIRYADTLFYCKLMEARGR